MDLRLLEQRLGVGNAKVGSKAAELLRMSQVKLPPGTLRQGEVARQAICFELACSQLSHPLDHKAVVRLSGTTEKVYAQTMVLMQKLLCVRKRLTAKELCIQFGCVRLEPAAVRALALYKERFVATLPPAQRAAADFARPAFIAAAFYLAARKMTVAKGALSSLLFWRKAKLKVDKGALLSRHCISSPEFTQVTTSMLDLCFDVLGVEAKKRRSAEVKTNRELLERQGAVDVDEGSSADEGSDGEGAVHKQQSSKRRRSDKGYEEWKENVVKAKAKHLSLDTLKQATLTFGR